ncbi:MAG: hypothetical protein E7057_04650 [Lentisphaerae bacterium]|nr:hypothetical protein [Lentisphaerota bacterium]
MLKKISIVTATAVLACGAVELPERIMSGYGGHFLGQQVENGHIWRMIGKLGEQKFNSIEVKFQQTLPPGVRKVQVDKFKGDIAKLYNHAKSRGLLFQIYLYPASNAGKRFVAWEEHAACPAVVSADGLEIPDVFAINDIRSWRALFEHAYSFAKIHKEVPFASLKFDIEVTPFIYSYDDATWGRFCAANAGFAADTPAAKRAALLKEKNAEALYKKFFEDEVGKAIKTFADELHAIAPELILGFMPSHHGVFSELMEKNLATDKVPAIVDGWELYNGAGYEDYIRKNAARAKKNHPNNRYVTWLRPDNYDAEDIAIHAYHAGANLDGYSIWVLWMLDEAQPKSIPKGLNAAGQLAAFGKANNALRADMAAKTLAKTQRIAFKKAKTKVAPIVYKDLVIPTLKPVGSGNMAGSVKQYILREQQVTLIYAKAGENIDVTLAHLAGKSRPTGLQYAVLDQQKNILRNESLTYGTRASFQIQAPHTGTYALVTSAGWGGQSWYSVEVKTPFAALLAGFGKANNARNSSMIYLFSPQKVFLPGKAAGNPGFRFETTDNESWHLAVDKGVVQKLKRPKKLQVSLPDKAVTEVLFGKADVDYSQNIFLYFPGGKNPLIFFGPERTVEIVK